MTPDSGTAQRLAILLELQRRAREARDIPALGFIAVNETRQLLPFRQAAIRFLRAPAGSRLILSGLARTDAHVPYNQWLNRFFDRLELRQPTPVTAADLPPDLAGDWSQWLPAHGLVLPLARPGGPVEGWLFLVREAIWDSAELALAAELAQAYGHALALLTAGQGRLHRMSWPTGRKRLSLWGASLAAVVILALFPVSLTVLAPAEVVAQSPFLVRAPIDGVIDRFQVRPNQAVEPGQLLFEFETTTLMNKYHQASGALAVSAEEYRQAAQMAVTSDKGRQDAGVRQGELETHRAEVKYTEQLLERSRVRAPQPGVAIFTDASDWVGRAVSIGEKVLEIADPARMELLVHLPMGDAIPLAREARVDLFLTVSPQTRYRARLEYASYRAEALPDGTMAYRLKARFEGELPPRIGLAGTAKLFGDAVPLIYYLFRRPLAVLRQWLGW